MYSTTINIIENMIKKIGRANDERWSISTERLDWQKGYSSIVFGGVNEQIY